jgi:hypothetical protein
VLPVGCLVTFFHLVGFVLAATSLGGLGCGRRATPADCRLIVDRSVELQAKELGETDPAVIGEREKRIRAALEDDIRECETRRVTDKTMACVQAATRTEELDRCLR